MNESSSPFSVSNPFSTRFTAPGRAPYFFDYSLVQQIKGYSPKKFEEYFHSSVGQGEELCHSICIRYLIDQFESRSCRGQIVGHHGSGKTTLLYALKDALIKQGYEIFSWTLHDQTPFVPDVFWMELQRFLQASPVLLPTKFLLPPPVMSQDEYIAEQRDFLKAVFPEKVLEDEPSPKDENNAAEEEFRVPEKSADEEVDASSEPSESKTLESTGVFGFNSAGNFGLKSACTADSDKPDFKTTDEPVKFAPFPEMPNSGDNREIEQEAFDDVELSLDGDDVDSAEPPSDVDPLSSEIPLNLSVDKRRSFFDRKVLVFDGFEQLSFANRIIIRTFCRMNRLGLLLTTHTPMIGVPVLFKTIPTVNAIHQLLDYLLEDYDDFKISDSEIEILLKNFQYDAREMLFALYDAFENFRLAPQDLREKIVRRYPR
ncbi:MAG: hypothetical protein ACOX0A_02410 [Thermoguttaceae bacterium]|jgi:energy-coupling factor transporter ATP-binding protein EcfA2